MRQSKSKIKEKTASLYLRLSRDDDRDGESYSIGNQRKLLTKVAKEKGYDNLLIYVDDGISGVTMNRPDYIRMIKDFEMGKSSALFVKDLSRIGRNYVEVGKMIEEFLPEHDIRLIAVSDCIDTFEGECEFAAIKNVFNEWYSRDISRKRRISNKIKGNAGEPLSRPPYGYIQNPENPKRWIIEEEAGSIVRRIFDLTMQGFGTEEIAAKLKEDNVLTPGYYWQGRGANRPFKRTSENPYAWSRSTVMKILNTQEYCGDIINFKTYSKSFKSKKRYANKPEDMAVFQNVNPAIIERFVWEKVHSRRNKVINRKTKEGEKNMFSGLLVCADCGSNLNFHFSQTNHDIKYFNCSGYNRGKQKICDTPHYIRADFLEQVVLGEIKRLIKFATKHNTDFEKYVTGVAIKNAKDSILLKEKELKSLKTRNKDIDILFERLYEDNVSGKISNERFNKLSIKYEEEQQEIDKKIFVLEGEISSFEDKIVPAKIFTSLIQKYTWAKKITPQMVNELIDRIEVFQSEKIDGKTMQKLKIHYACIGTLEIPDLKWIPENNAQIHTRQGVDICFSTAGQAVSM